MSSFTKVTILALILCVGSQVAAAQGRPAPADSATLAEGRRLYEGRGLCAGCHGMTGEGILGPTLRLDAGKPTWIHFDGTLAGAITLITRGIPAGSTTATAEMPPRGGARLTDAQVAAVAAYVLDLHQRKPK